MSIHRRLYRSVLQRIRQFKRADLPLLGLAGTEGQAVLPHAQSTDINRLVRHLFQQPPQGLSEDSAFAAIRVLGAQYEMLASADDLTRSACSAWRSTISATLAADTDNTQITIQEKPQLRQPSFTPHHLATSLNQTALLVTQLHGDTQPFEGGEEDERDPDEPDEPEPGDKQHWLVMSALYQQGLNGALDEMARQLHPQHPGLFPCTSQTPPPMPPHAASSVTMQQPSPNSNQPINSLNTSAITPQLLAIRKYLYRDLRLRHEPIEWLYDGISPLLPASALSKRKAAPFTLSILACLLCHKLGITAVPIRAAPALPHVSTGQAALSGGALMPEDVATRQAGRAASYIPSDSWLLAAVHPHANPTPGNRIPGYSPPSQPHKNLTNGHTQEASGKAGWQFSGVFLDVSVRGGAVLSREQVAKTYPQALEPYTKQGIELVSASAYLQLCVDWVRAVMVAHQRRGESDLVAHWLVQLLALDPAAPEWDLMLGHES